ncbi:hypothetical protein CW368_05815 [Actinomycetales bacterium SN12]|nr:hypothetical protein CW368_05815 [Actinomycetales bacterium SN12]
MNVETTGVRRSAVYLWGALFVLAWALLSAVLGAGEARADDEPPAPLSGITSLVGDTLGGVVTPVAKTVTSTVEQVASPVVSTVEKAVTKTTTTVASVPVVGAPAAQVVEKVGDTVSSATQTVEDVVASAPVSAIVTPVTDAVSSVPVVGSIVDGLGATDLVNEVATGVDKVLDVVPPVIESTVDPVVDGLKPGIPSTGGADLPELDLPLADAANPAVDSAAGLAVEPEAVPTVPATAAPAAAPTAQSSASVPLVLERGAVVTLPRDSSAQQTAPSGDPHGAPASSPGVVTPTSAAGGSGGAPGTSSDRPSSDRLDLDVSSRTGIPADAALPASPAGSTDVSPD